MKATEYFYIYKETLNYIQVNDKHRTHPIKIFETIVKCAGNVTQNTAQPFLPSLVKTRK
jgi:hypothetical protein